LDSACGGFQVLAQGFPSPLEVEAQAETGTGAANEDTCQNKADLLPN
jgi:hypothetical protein